MDDEKQENPSEIKHLELSEALHEFAERVEADAKEVAAIAYKISSEAKVVEKVTEKIEPVLTWTYNTAIEWSDYFKSAISIAAIADVLQAALENDHQEAVEVEKEAEHIEHEAKNVEKIAEIIADATANRPVLINS